jgi:hypothetical protein
MLARIALLGVSALALAAPADARIIDLISTGNTPPAGVSPDHRAQFMGASADGSRMVFQTDESLAAADTDTRDDVYLREGSALTLVTPETTSNDLKYSTGFGAINADGSRVFVKSSEPVAGNTDGITDDYFLWRHPASPLELLTGNGNTQLQSSINNITINAEGTRAFWSGTDVFDGDSDSALDAYMWDDADDAIHLLSVGASLNAVFNGTSSSGDKAVFSTESALAGTGDTDTTEDVYLWNDGVITLLTGSGQNTGAFHRLRTPDLAKMVFSSAQNGLAAGDADNTTDALVVDTATGAITSATPGTAQSVWPNAVSADGNTVVFETDEQLVDADDDTSQDLYRSQGGAFTLLTGGVAQEDALFRGASADASRVVFASDEALPGTGDTDGTADFFVSDGTTIQRVTGNTGASSVQGGFPHLSADGTRIAFSTTEALGGDADTARDVYLWEQGTTTWISFTCAGTASAELVRLSADGQRVYFDTDNQVPGTGDGDEEGDAYVSRPGTAPLTQDCDPSNDPRPDDDGGDAGAGGDGGGGGGAGGGGTATTTTPGPPPPSPRRPSAPRTSDPIRFTGSTTFPVSGGFTSVTLTNSNDVPMVGTVRYDGTGTMRVFAAQKKARRAPRLGSARFTIPPRSTLRVRVRLSKAVRRILRPRRRLRATLVVTTTAPQRGTLRRRVILRGR